MSLSLIGGLGAILNIFIKEYTAQGHSVNQVVQLITVPSLCIGLGNYIILPFALAFGHRPTFLLSTTILFFATIGSAVQNSYEAHIATRIIQGLATGATESLLLLMLTEISFIHKRGIIFGCYWATQTAFSSGLNIASSYEAVSLSWRWFYWVYVIAIGVGLIIAIIGGFETHYQRPAMALGGRVIVADKFGVTRILSPSEAQHHLAESERIQAETASRPKKTWLQMMKSWSKPSPRPLRTMLAAVLHIVQSLTSPGILWKAENVGLINVGGIIGSLYGMAYAGWFADKFILWMARRFASLLLYGFTASGNATWWGPYLGWTLFQVVFVSILIISTAFAAEAWPKNPDPAIVVVVGTKNLISFGASYAGILGAIFLLGIPVYLYNPKWRSYTANGEEGKDSVIGHA
ncbi:MFS general substrate transporter [Glonium stellatum]|uniref:MFS general substrate transporter n=1 Tax=Glonium stellatum TaxID=574774 RepID=A0A8E2FE33_9PEZI|nr:MFS general substrate transporter [Glonium stellatum]